MGRIEVINDDKKLNKFLWYDALGDYFTSPDDERLCTLMFKPQTYHIFIDGQTIRGSF